MAEHVSEINEPAESPTIAPAGGAVAELESAPRLPRKGRRVRAGRLPPQVARVVGVGASAGGLEAFTEFLRMAPTDAGIAYVLVQHLDPTHRSLLVELLGKATALPVREVTDQMPVAANEVHVIPPNCDLTIREGVLYLSPRQKAEGGSRTIDHFFRTLAADQRENAVAVILSGAGSDGAEGLRTVKAVGGLTLAQKENDARYDSMPRSAIATGCVDFVLPADKMAAEIARTLRRPGGAQKRAATNARKRGGALGKAGGRPFGDDGSDGVAWPAAPSDVNLRKVFFLLRTRTGIDFSLYRMNTVRRRLQRRFTVNKVSDLADYVQLLRRHPAELDALHQDLLINVSSFFRNPSVFEALKKRVFPKLVQLHDGSDPIRIWIAGCAMGQEAYSMAIAYTEFAQQHGTDVPLQIFATDVNPSVLEYARAGRYTPAQLAQVSPARLARHFVRDGENYRVQKSLRDRIVFAPQNLLSHPPFTRVDLISCRNVLIYLETAMQQKIIPTFHYALRPGGYLVLGTSETVGQFTNLFESKEKSHKIFLKKPAASWIRLERPAVVPRPAPVVPIKPGEGEFNAHDAQKEADRVTLNKYAPASVLIDDDGEILQFRGEIRPFLELPRGKAHYQLLKMAREELELPLQRLLQQAKKRHKTARETGLVYEKGRATVDVEVVPLKTAGRRCFLVLFHKAAPAPASKAAARPLKGKTRGAGQAADLRHEYARTREHLATLQEAHDTSIEELQSSNEEVQSANEELQSLNEELETSNEELESANEELTTLNEELGTRNNELRESERRLREQNQLLELAPVLVRSPKDRVLYWNKGAEKLYGFSKEEALGQLSHLLLGATYTEPLEAILARLWRDGQWEGEVQHRRKDGSQVWVAAQWVVHYDEQGKARAVLEANADISARKRAEEALRASENLNRSILDSSPDGICVLDSEGRLRFITPQGLRMMDATGFESVEGTFWPNFWEGEHRAAAEAAYRGALQGKATRFQVQRKNALGAVHWWDVAICPIAGEAGRALRLLAVARDITDQKETELAAQQMTRLNALRLEVAAVITAAKELDPALQQITEILVRHIGVAFARCWVLPAGGDTLELRASAGLYTHLNGAHARVPVGKYKIGRIAANRKAHLSNDLSQDQEISDPEWARKEGMVAFAGHPLAIGDRVVGVLAMFARHPLEARTLQEIALSAESLAQFIERKMAEEEKLRLYEEANVARREVELLNEVGRSIGAELSIDRLTAALAEAATRLTRAEFGAFFYNVRDGLGKEYSLASFAGRASHCFAEEPPPQLMAPFAGELGSDGPVRIDDLEDEAKDKRSGFHLGLLASRLTIRSCLVVPVRSRAGNLLGGLYFGHSAPGMFSPRDERMISGLAVQVSVAMDNAHVFDQLERKVEERTVRLKETIADLQAFSYTVSHDLRAPLRAMQSYAQALKEDHGAELNDGAKRYLTRIETAGLRLDRLIQDVLTYSRISQGSLSLGPVDLDRLVREIIEQYPNISAIEGAVTIEGKLPRAMAEESSATQCFSNLIGNALKFVPKGVAPRIRIRAEEAGERWRVWVEDNGIGIAPDNQERIFKMFERVSGEGEYEGTGIGLAIVRKAMERMGGSVGLESRLGEGSRFWLEFHKP